MTSNRPFISNFLTAFRAHSAIQKAATTSSNTAATSPYPHTTPTGTSTNSSVTSSRTITTTKTGHTSSGATTAAVQATGQFQPTRQHAAPYHRSTSPAANGFPIPGAGKARRGSDSSSEGFREAMGAEKWYIGGRTAGGEERYYKLGMVKRHKSVDRLSLDRLSI